MSWRVICALGSVLDGMAKDETGQRWMEMVKGKEPTTDTQEELAKLEEPGEKTAVEESFRRGRASQAQRCRDWEGKELQFGKQIIGDIPEHSSPQA